MLNRSPISKLVLSGIVIFGVGVIVLNTIPSAQRSNDSKSTQNDDMRRKSRHTSHRSNVTKADISSNTKLTKFIDGKIDITQIPIRTYRIPMNTKKNENILVREAGEGNYHILLLHGQQFSSETWQKIGTLQHLSHWGYRAFAIDIPHKGDRSLPVNRKKESVQWLTELINRLHLNNLVIISPSMSGRLTLPYIFQLKEQQQLIRGFVPIAPAGTTQYDLSDFEKIKIPTLIVHGEKDIAFKSAFDSLKKIPSSKILLIKNASHACYYERPIEFHRVLRQFLYNVYRPIYTKSSTKFHKKVSLSSMTTRKKHTKKIT